MAAVKRDIESQAAEKHPPTLPGIFFEVAWRCVFQGAWHGAVYGAGYGAVYSLCTGLFIVGPIYGVPYGFIIGLPSGIMLGLINACVLGTMTVWYTHRHYSALKTRWTYEDAALNVSVIVTLLISPFVLRAMYQLVFQQPVSLIELPVVTAPSLVAAFAAYQSHRLLVKWYAITVLGKSE
jgi:hypothetical protein